MGRLNCSDQGQPSQKSYSVPENTIKITKKISYCAAVCLATFRLGMRLNVIAIKAFIEMCVQEGRIISSFDFSDTKKIAISI
ncbi:hypothetical protein BFG52_05175 [Acinetobacter larvae]|uniref:Uncharacterized protein n=1 Tax=Acinetobacter larvae TaxID=1789224 RepID=A0A1B2LXV6_9GAMM|nr:hypothetical protein BFG52_05175 [Acinetobacter larvae]